MKIKPPQITNPYKARAYLTGNQTLSDNVVTKITLNTESFDTNNNFDKDTNYRYTVPVTGYYQINAAVYISGATNTNSGGVIKKGGSTDILYGTYSSIGLGNVISRLSGLVYLEAGEYIELFASGDVSTGSVTIIAGSAWTYLDICLIST